MHYSRWRDAYHIYFSIGLIAVFITFFPGTALSGVKSRPWIFNALQQKLIKDGFDKQAIDRIYDSPDIAFVDHIVGSFLMHKESTLNYKQFTSEKAIENAKRYMRAYNDHLSLAQKKYGVDKIPATVVVGKNDYGIKYYGVPSGYEIASLLEDIVDVSGNDSGLSSEARELLKQVTGPLHLQVFVTPTCPYCPKAVRLAHKLAIENPNITADMVEATEFPHLAMRYNVSGVPRTMIGEETPIEGAAPEMMLVEKVVEAFNAQKQ